MHDELLTMIEREVKSLLPRLDRDELAHPLDHPATDEHTQVKGKP